MERPYIFFDDLSKSMIPLKLGAADRGRSGQNLEPKWFTRKILRNKELAGDFLRREATGRANRPSGSAADR